MTRNWPDNWEISFQSSCVLLQREWKSVSNPFGSAGRGIPTGYVRFQRGQAVRQPRYSLCLHRCCNHDIPVSRLSCNWGHVHSPLTSHRNELLHLTHRLHEAYSQSNMCFAKRNSQSQALWKISRLSHLAAFSPCGTTDFYRFGINKEEILTAVNFRAIRLRMVSHTPAVFFLRSLNCLRDIRFGIFPCILAVCTQKPILTVYAFWFCR